MKLIPLLLFVALVQVSAESYSQEKISISEKNASLEKIFKEIRKQSKYDFLYINEQLQGAPKVSVVLKDVSLEQALKEVLKNSSFTYSIQDKTIVIRLKEEKKGSSSSTDGTGLKNETPPPPPPTIDLRGIVVNEKGEPVEGATVAVKGTDKKTSTNGKGEFTLNGVNEKLTLVISAVTIETKEVAVNGQVFVKVEVTGKVNDLDEVVMVAYGKTTQRANTGSIVVIKGEQIQNLPNRSFDRSLQGLVPGLLITSGSGQPGGGVANFVLRGIATGGDLESIASSRNPLIIIDGVPVNQEPAVLVGITSPIVGIRFSNPLAQLNPSDIESVSILKDASAVALYGSKASNGVILITTKKGKLGKTTFSFRHQIDVADRLEGNIQMLSQSEYIELLYEAYRNSNPGWTDAQIKSDLISKFPYRISGLSDTLFYPEADWNQAIYRNQAITLSNNLSISGGNERNTFYFNIEYTKQDGVVRKTGFDRKSFRFNYETQLAQWLKMGLNTTSSYTVQNVGSSSQIGAISRISPLLPQKQDNGEDFNNYSWGLSASSTAGYLTPNPLVEQKLNIDRNVSYRNLSRLYGEIKLSKGLTITSSIGADFMLNEAKQKVHPLLAIDGALSTAGSISDQTTRDVNIISNNIFRYNNVFNNDHTISVAVGQEMQMLNRKIAVAKLTGITANPSIEEIGRAGGTPQYVMGEIQKQTMLSYFSQVNYGFRNKYFVSGSIRSDGSSSFGTNNRFGTYWSIGGSWIVSSEPFWKKWQSWGDYLKLRGSFGPAGNSAGISAGYRFDPLQMLGFLNNSSAVIPSSGARPGNPNLKWEETFGWNLGIDLKMFRQRISFSVDLYQRSTKNLISEAIPIPYATGFAVIDGNVGDIKNSGIELSVSSVVVKSRDFALKVSGNWSRNRNTLTNSLLPIQSLSGGVANEVGREYNSFYIPVWSGVNPINGRPTWFDASGKPTEVYNNAKLEFVGKAQPDGFGNLTFSMDWKGFSLSSILYYQYGSEILYGQGSNSLGNDGAYPYINQAKGALNRWRNPGDISSNPRRLLNNRVVTGSGTITDQGTQLSTRHLFDGDFIRLSNVSISYAIPAVVTNRIKLNSASVFLQVHNLATWTRYQGQDPENISPFGAGNILYPQQRSFSAGLNIQF